MERKVILYIAVSLDGYIAGPGDDLSFLDPMDREGEDYGYEKFIATVDTVILGRRTYDWVMKHAGYFPHADKEAYIITKSPRPPEGKTTFYTGDLKELIAELKQKDGKNIFCDGGAEVVHALLKDELIDEMTIAVIPVLLGDGIRLFKDGRPEMKLKLVTAIPFDSGLVQLQYKRLIP